MSDADQIVEEPIRAVSIAVEGCCYGCFKVTAKAELPNGLCVECVAARSAVLNSTEE